MSTSTGQRRWRRCCDGADVDRHVAASGAYQDVGGAGSGLQLRRPGRRAPTTTAASAATADVVASTCSPGDAASSTNTQSEPATARSSATTDASKATPSSSRICMSAVGSSGTAGSTRSSWTRSGHRLATYALAAGTGAGSPPSEAHAGGGIADPQPGGSVVAAHDLDLLCRVWRMMSASSIPRFFGFGDKPGPQRMRRIPRCVLETS